MVLVQNDLKRGFVLFSFSVLACFQVQKPQVNGDIVFGKPRFYLQTSDEGTVLNLSFVRRNGVVSKKWRWMKRKGGAET